MTEPRARIAEVPSWYHTIEVAPGVVTPGWFDLRPTVDELPWPEVRGKRCLDVGTYDGFLAFELERRGAAEVVATEVSDPADWDWPIGVREGGVEWQRQTRGKRPGFDVARELLGSSTRLEHINVYDLSPERVGSFDVVVCGSLLLHLRDPVRALTAIRSVCRGHLLSTNQVDPRPLLYRRRPLARLDGVSDLGQWWLPNAAGHRQMVTAGGFQIERESALYPVLYGEGHFKIKNTPGWVATKLFRRVFAGGHGVPHHALLARPRQNSGER